MDNDVKTRAKPEDVPYGVIYVVTNKINGKQYVGQTTEADPWTRWNKHISDAYNLNSKGYDLKFHQALRKYGWRNFEFKEIDSAFDESELDEKEIAWIAKLDTFLAGYNANLGGIGGQRLITREKELEVVRVYKLIKQVSDTALKIGISRDSVRKILEKHGYTKADRVDNGLDILRIPVVGFELNSNTPLYARSITDAARDLIKILGLNHAVNTVVDAIRDQLQGQKENVYGFRFYHVDQDVHAQWLLLKGPCKQEDPSIILIDAYGKEYHVPNLIVAINIIQKVKHLTLTVNQKHDSRKILSRILKYGNTGKDKSVRGFVPRYATPEDIERHEARLTGKWKEVRDILDTYDSFQLNYLMNRLNISSFPKNYSHNAKLDILCDTVIQHSKQKEAINK